MDQTAAIRPQAMANAFPKYRMNATGHAKAAGIVDPHSSVGAGEIPSHPGAMTLIAAFARHVPRLAGWRLRMAALRSARGQTRLVADELRPWKSETPLSLQRDRGHGLS
ncbi:hypothetical protein MPC1_10014 [Methylocella tundrae]|nr:hypothetical protein MPC1_10014 [Methylocella tundrae]